MESSKETAKEAQSHMINKIFGNAPLNDTRQVNIEFLWELSNNCELFSVSKKKTKCSVIPNSQQP